MTAFIIRRLLQAVLVMLVVALIAFLMFRFYGAKPELWNLKWKLGDPELVTEELRNTN